MPSTPFYAILAKMTPERRARIAAGAKALKEADAGRKAQYVDEQAAALYIEMPLAHLRETRLTGALPGSLCKRIGGTIRYRLGDLDGFMDSHLVDQQ